MRKEANMQDEREKPKEINHKIVDLQVLQIFGFDGKWHYSLLTLRKEHFNFLKEKYRLKFTQTKSI